MGEEDRKKGRRRIAATQREREGERESEREGQTPQQQAWETSEITRGLENSHNRQAQRERPLSRDLLEVE